MKIASNVLPVTELSQPDGVIGSAMIWELVKTTASFKSPHLLAQKTITSPHTPTVSDLQSQAWEYLEDH